MLTCSLSPRVKTHNYLNMIMGELEVRDRDPEAWAVLLDENGSLCEGIGSNIFVVKDGRISTPLGKYVLEGISRQTVPVHIKNVYRKLEATNRSEAVFNASRNGLIRL